MASRFPLEDNGQLRTRKSHDMKWSCEKHGEPIKFYCKDHTVPICHPCATKDHPKSCQLAEIEHVILEMRKRIEDTRTKIAPAKKRLKTLRSKLESSETSTSNHLQSVNDNVNATYDEKLNSVKDKERDEIRLINKEADEEIRIINEKRNRRFKACKEEAQRQRQILKDSAAKPLSDIHTILGKVKKKINELKSKHQHFIDKVDNVDSKIERMKQDDKALVQEAPQVIASLDASLSSNVHQEVADYLDRIERVVQRVKFVEGEVGGKHYGRIDGYIGKWELVRSIDIPAIVNEPRVCGLISDDEIVLGSKGNALYVTNIRTDYTEKVIEGDRNMYATSCAPVDSDVIVCGKIRFYCLGDSLDGCITLYDRQWKVIRDIPIPRNTSSSVSAVYIDVDRDGMILAAQCDESNIYVINPADGKIVNTITMQAKKVSDGIQAMSSGDIAVNTGNEFTVISRSGERKAVIHCDERAWAAECYVDKLTDTLYITNQNELRKIYTVDQVSCDGDIQARRFVEFMYRQSEWNPYTSPCLVTPSGNLVGCDGNKLLMYNNSFIL